MTSVTTFGGGLMPSPFSSPLASVTTLGTDAPAAPLTTATPSAPATEPATAATAATAITEPSTASAPPSTRVRRSLSLIGAGLSGPGSSEEKEEPCVDLPFTSHTRSPARMPTSAALLSGLTCTQRGGVGHTSAPQRLPLQSHLGSSSA